MNRIKLSIKYKLILLITIFTLASSLIGLFMINFYVKNKIQNYTEHESEVFAKLIGQFVVPALAFNDKEGALDIISKAKLIDKVNSIVVLDTLGNIFIDYKVTSPTNRQQFLKS